VRRALLEQPAVAEQQQLRRVDDGVKPVRDRQNRRAAKRGAQRRLDEQVRLGVDGGRRLIHQQHAAAARERARHAEELALAAREVGAALAQLRVEAERQRAHVGREVRLPARGGRGCGCVVARRAEGRGDGSAGVRSVRA
jgi:hypothetical protein